ncbi:MAG: hypothetical protein QOJ59_376 [Thermomicrobiales bacterium]|nr:hypothetical protein [Thermomicrobiales bacterium]
MPLRKRRLAQVAMVMLAASVAALTRPRWGRPADPAPVARTVRHHRQRPRPSTGRVRRQSSGRSGILASIPSVATIVALGGLLFTAAQVANEHSATKRQLALLGAQTANETFAQAITALGDERMPIRVGGIYVLQQVANASASDYWRALSVLTAYLHEAIPRRELLGTPTPPPAEGLPADVQAVFVALSERNRAWDGGRALDLSRLDLRNARLPGVDLAGATLSYSDLDGAVLTGADLTGSAMIQASLQTAALDGAELAGALLASADLRFVRLDGANLRGASLADAKLDLASLRNAHLEGADFDRANLVGVNLTGAHLEGADLSTAIGLTLAQIATAIIDDATRLPWETASSPTGTAG